jgi:hypothetical protein
LEGGEMKTRTFFYISGPLFVLIVGISLFFIPTKSIANTYCVANESDLITALNNAKDNGEDDVIKIQQGKYYGNFVYTSTESFDVIIEGGYSDASCTMRVVDPTNTVLDGGGSEAVLILSTNTIADLGIEGLTLENGNSMTHGGGLYINTNGNIYG